MHSWAAPIYLLMNRNKIKRLCILAVLLLLVSLTILRFNKTADIQIEDGYYIWSLSAMHSLIQEEQNRHSIILHRSNISMYIEWWMHNIGYYMTKPLCFIDCVERIHLRCKDVDL